MKEEVIYLKMIVKTMLD